MEIETSRVFKQVVLQSLSSPNPLYKVISIKGFGKKHQLVFLPFKIQNL